MNTSKNKLFFIENFKLTALSKLINLPHPFQNPQLDFFKKKNSVSEMMSHLTLDTCNKYDVSFCPKFLDT